MRSLGGLETGAALAAIGGFLNLLDGLFLLSVFGSLNFLMGSINGLTIVGLSLSQRGRPAFRRQAATAILLLAAVSFFIVSGFYIGALLGLIGAVLLLTSPGTGPWRAGSSGSFSRQLGAPCGRCGRPVPTWTSKCPYCGYPD